MRRKAAYQQGPSIPTQDGILAWAAGGRTGSDDITRRFIYSSPANLFQFAGSGARAEAGARSIPALGRVLNLDYEHYKDIYLPEIVRSRLENRHSDTFETSFRAHKDTPWTSITLNVNTEVIFSMPDSEHASSRSHSTRVAQVENAGRPDEHEDTIGHDSGYLWRLNTYWRFEARDGGVVAEWESIALSRDIPFLLRWIVRPYVERLARTTALGTLVATRNEVRKRVKAATKTHKP